MEVPDIDNRVVTNPDDVTDFWQWLTSHTSHVGCDIETGSDPEGSELIWHKPGFHVRMVQFGDRAHWVGRARAGLAGPGARRVRRAALPPG